MFCIQSLNVYPIVEFWLSPWWLCKFWQKIDEYLAWPLQQERIWFTSFDDYYDFNFRCYYLIFKRIWLINTVLEMGIVFGRFGLTWHPNFSLPINNLLPNQVIKLDRLIPNIVFAKCKILIRRPSVIKAGTDNKISKFFPQHSLIDLHQ